MKMVSISRDKADYCLRAFEVPPDLRESLQAGEQKQRIELTDDEADLLRDLCGERLQTHGFGANYVPNQEGIILEELIDDLYIDDPE